MKVLILTGPSGVGKNIVAAVLAGKLSRCAVIDVDVVRWMVLQPHKAPWDGEEGKAQQKLGVQNTCLLTRSFVNAGFDVIILNVLTDETARLYKAELKEIEPKIVLLLPTLDEIKRRNAVRGRRLTDDEVERVYDCQQHLTVYDTEIDNTHLSAKELAARLADLYLSTPSFHVNPTDSQEDTMLQDLIRKNRSYRRFHQNVPVELETLRALVNLARLSASGANLQPLKYILSCDPETNAGIFPHTRWADYLKDWGGPTEGERPVAYIVILGDTEIRQSFGCDHGIAAQSIMLGATERGLGGCIIGSIDRDGLRQTLDIPERYEILLVLALGRPRETVVLEEVGPGGDIRYYRDTESVHHVPKRSLDELILREYRR